jgi:hypothetical protein
MAVFVEKLELPLRKMPAKVRTMGSALCVADGPSFREYDPEDLNTAYKIYAYGRTPLRIQPDVILLIDQAFEGALLGCKPCEVRVPKDSVYGHLPLNNLFERPADPGDESPLLAPGVLDGFSFAWTPPGASISGLLNAVADGCRRIFLLGYDGYHHLDGATREPPHWHLTGDLEYLRRAHAKSTKYYDSVGWDVQAAMLELADCNRINWEFSNRAVFEADGMNKPVWNLGPSSRHSLVWDTHPDVLSQPFGRIDRQGPATVIYILDTFTWLDCEVNRDKIPNPEGYRGPPPIPERGLWGPLSVHHHVRFISRLREECPRQAIYVLSDTAHDTLVRDLPPDIQVADIVKTPPPEKGFHVRLGYLRLPPIA